MIANKVNTYYTRATARFKAAPRSRGAARSLRLAAVLADADWALVQAQVEIVPRGMGYYKGEIGHSSWLRAAGFLA